MLFSTALAFVLVVASPAHAVKVEKGAYISEEYEDPKLLSAIVTVIRAYGYRCDSISGFRPFISGRGFKVRCNNSAYHYELKDRGGTWVAEFID